MLDRKLINARRVPPHMALHKTQLLTKLSCKMKQLLTTLLSPPWYKSRGRDQNCTRICNHQDKTVHASFGALGAACVLKSFYYRLWSTAAISSQKLCHQQKKWYTKSKKHLLLKIDLSSYMLVQREVVPKTCHSQSGGKTCGTHADIHFIGTDSSVLSRSHNLSTRTPHINMQSVLFLFSSFPDQSPKLAVAQPPTQREQVTSCSSAAACPWKNFVASQPPLTDITDNTSASVPRPW